MGFPDHNQRWVETMLTADEHAAQEHTRDSAVVHHVKPPVVIVNYGPKVYINQLINLTLNQSARN